MDDKWSCLGVAVAFVVALVVGTILNGMVLSILWGWFIVPIFHLPLLNIVEAIGLALIIGMLTYQSNDINSTKSSEEKSVSKLVTELWVRIIARPLMYLLVGWIVSLFL